jgi:hypothetical protein
MAEPLPETDFKRLTAHVDEDATVINVTRSLSRFESLYSLMLWHRLPAFAEASPKRLHEQLALMLPQSQLSEISTSFDGSSRDGFQLRKTFDIIALIPEKWTMRVASVLQTNSFDVSVTGVGDAIQAAAELVDHSSREERRGSIAVR